MPNWRSLIHNLATAPGDIAGGIGDDLDRARQYLGTVAGTAGDAASAGVSGVGTMVDDTASQLARARQWLDENTPAGLQSAGQSAARAGYHIFEPNQATSNDLFGTGPAALRYAPPTGIKDALRSQLATDIGNVTAQTIAEPIAYGVNRLPGIGNDQVRAVDADGKPVGPSMPSGGPFSGANRLALQQGADDTGNPLLSGAAKAGIAGLDTVTNPLTYLPTSGPMYAQLLAGSQGIGGFGGNTVAQKAAMALTGAAGMSGGSDLLGAVTNDNPIAQFAGGAAGAALLHRAGRGLPGGAALFGEASPIEKPQGLPNPIDTLFRTPRTGEKTLTALDDQISSMVAANKPVPQDLAAKRNTLYDLMFHGTGDTHLTPDPGKFDPNGHFGPAWYATDSPLVADSYAMRGGAPQVRPVNIPRNLNLFDANAPFDPAALTTGLTRAGEPGVAAAIRQHLGDQPYNGDQAYRMLEGLLGDRTTVNKTLALAGYDGVRYDGGQVMPLMDGNGQPITHTAVAIFPESLPKIRNALSGTAMGIVPVDAAKQMGPVRLPQDPGFTAAADATSGAKLTPDGLEITVKRLQRPEYAGTPPPSGQVSYAAKDQFLGRLMNAYGGAEEVQGTTLLRRPLSVRGEMGTLEAKVATLDALHGIPASGFGSTESRTAINTLTSALAAPGDRQGVLVRAGIPLADAARLVSSAGSDTRRMASGAVDLLLATRARAAGYDGIVYYSNVAERDWAAGYDRQVPRISEVVDLRESTAPKGSAYTLRPEYQPNISAMGAVGEGQGQAASAPEPGSVADLMAQRAAGQPQMMSLGDAATLPSAEVAADIGGAGNGGMPPAPPLGMPTPGPLGRDIPSSLYADQAMLQPSPTIAPRLEPPELTAARAKLAAMAPPATAPTVTPEQLAAVGQDATARVGRLGAALDRVTAVEPVARNAPTEGVVYMRKARTVAESEGVGLNVTGRDLNTIVQTARANGEIVPTPARAAYEAARIAAAGGPDSANGKAMADFFNSDVNIAQNRASYLIRPGSAAAAALDTGDGIQQQIGDFAGSRGVPPPAPFGPDAWKTASGQPARVPSGTVYSTGEDAIAAGLRPAFVDRGDLWDQQVRSAVNVASRQQMVDLLKSVPDALTTDPAYAEAQGNYTRVSGDMLARLPELRALAERPAAVDASQQSLDLGLPAAPASGDVFIQKKWAGALDNYLKPADAPGRLGSLVKSGFDLARAPLFSYNVAHIGRLEQLAGTQEVANRPLVGLFSAPAHFVQALSIALRPDALENFRRYEIPKWSDAMRNVVSEGGNAAMPEQAAYGPVSRWAKWGDDKGLFGSVVSAAPKGAEAIHEFIFEKYLPVRMTLAADTIEQGYLKNVGDDGTLQSGRYKGMTADQVHQDVGRAIDNSLQGLDRLQAGMGSQTSGFMGMARLAPMWQAGRLRQFGQALRDPGIEGDMARRFFVANAVLGLGIAAGATVALSDDKSPGHFAALLDPRNPNSVLNPNSPAFMSVQLPNGARVQPFTVETPMVKALLTPFSRGIGAGAEALDAPQTSLLDTVKRVAIAAGTQTTSNLRAITDYGFSGSSVPVKEGMTLLMNKQRFGDTESGNIVAPGSSGGDTARQLLGHVGTNLIPMAATAFTGEATGSIPPEYQESLSGVARGALAKVQAGDVAGAMGDIVSFTPAIKAVTEQAGVRLTAPAADPARFKGTTAVFLASQGVTPGPDPIGQLRSGDGLAPSAVAKFYTDHKDVDQYIRDKRMTKLEQQNGPVGMAAASGFATQTGVLTEVRDKAIQDAIAKQQSGQFSGNDFRKAAATAWSAYTDGYNAIGQSLFHVTAADITALQAEKHNPMLGVRDVIAARQQDAYGAKDPPTGLLDRAINDYEAIRQTDDTPEARDAMFAARRAFLAPGGGADQLYGTGQADAVRASLRDKYVRIGGEPYGKYYDAQQLMGAYGEIPQYNTMDAPTARLAQGAINRARQEVQAGLLPPKAERLGILMDDRLDDTAKIAALRILKDGSKLVNRQRAQFRLDHPQIAYFYSDLNSEDFMRLAQLGTGAA